MSSSISVCDCSTVIVEPTPIESLSLNLGASKGHRQILRNLAQYRPLYQARSGVAIESMQLVTQQVWTSTTGGQVLVVWTSGPLNLILGNPDGTTTELQIQRLLVLDQLWSTLHITNQQQSTADLELIICK